MTRQEKKKQTKKAILEAAIELFGANGFESTSISQLAKKAGVGKGTVYSYFNTKHDILQAFCDGELEFIHEQLTTKSDQDSHVIDQMVTIYMAEFEYIRRNPEFGRLYMQEIVFPRKALLEQHKEQENKYFEMLFPIIEKAKERGEVRRDMEPLHICGHFYALYLLIVHAWYSDIIREDEAEEAMRALFHQAVHGIAPEHSTIARCTP